MPQKWIFSAPMECVGGSLCSCQQAETKDETQYELIWKHLEGVKN